jgi:hypothetical protein
MNERTKRGKHEARGDAGTRKNERAYQRKNRLHNAQPETQPEFSF